MEDHMAGSVSTEEEQSNLSGKRSIDRKILNAFWKLVEVRKDDRLKAAEELVLTLMGKQETFEGQGLCPEVSYSIDRLVKGVASTRKAARQGFTVTLSEILRTCLEIPVNAVLQSVSDNLQLKGNQNKATVVIGQALVYGAIIRSGRLKDFPDCIPLIVSSLRKLSQNRNYVEQLAMKLLSEVLCQLSEEEFSQHLWSYLKSDLISGWNYCTPENLWLLLFCSKKFPNSVSEKFLKKHWDTDDILDRSCYHHLSRIIKQSTSVHPNVHLLCSDMLNFVVDRKDMKEFWKEVIDNTLFDPSQREKMYLGFQLIKIILPCLKKSKQVHWILSSQFCNAFLKVICTNHHPLFSAASELADFLVQFVKESDNPKTQMIIVKIFLSPDMLRFDQTTKKKRISAMITQLKTEATEEYWNLMKSMFLANGKERLHDKLSIDQERIFALNQMSLLANSSVSSDDEWKNEIIQFLVLHSFFDLRVPIEDLPQCQDVPLSINPAVRQACQECFLKALSFPMRQTGGSTLQLKSECSILQSVVDFTTCVLQQPEYAVPIIPVSEIREIWSKILAMIHKLDKQSGKDGKLNESTAFKILFQYLGFQVFIDTKCSKEALEELCECCSRTLKTRKHKLKENNEAAEEVEPEWIDVVVDVLLMVLSRASQFTHSVIVGVFRLLCPFVTETSLNQILNVINPEKSSTDDDPLVEDENDSEIDDNAEFESGSSSSEVDLEHSSEDETVKSNPEDIEFKNKIHEALGNAADVSDTESTYLSDSEMFKLDEALAETFRNRKKNSHKMPSEHQQFLLNFRIRCMDLIIAYLKEEPLCPRILQCIPSLLSALEYGHKQQHEKRLSRKACAVIQHILKQKKFQDVANVDKSYLTELLQLVLRAQRKNTNHTCTKLISSLAIYVVQCGRKHSQISNTLNKKIRDEDKSWFLEEYQKALSDYAEQSHTHLNPWVFQLLLNSCPDIAMDLAESFQKYAFHPDIRLYKRTHCLGILNSALRLAQSQESLTLETWSEFYQPVVQSITEIIDDVADSEEIKPMYVTQLMEVLITIMHVSKKFNEDPLEGHRDLLNSLKKFSGEKRKRLQGRGGRLWKKLVVHLGGSVTTQKQKKRQEVSHEENTTKKKKKKWGKSKKP